ncbi:MAG: GTPase, partial [Candidatus Hydrogenedentota bacterium]
MSKNKKLPLVAICGRPNVGKSTLYNRICGKQRAIIHDLEGITRDRHYARANWERYTFDIVDTGGIVQNPEDAIVEKMQEQVRMALRDATVVVFVVDGQAELTVTDFDVRDELFKLGKPVVLATNKLDNPTLEMNRHNFYEL